jgi:hypothetical protein
MMVAQLGFAAVFVIALLLGPETKGRILVAEVGVEPVVARPP